MRSLSISSTFLIVALVAATLAALPTRGITATMAAVRNAISPMTTRISTSEKPVLWLVSPRLGRLKVFGRLIGARSKMSPGFGIKPQVERRTLRDHRRWTRDVQPGTTPDGGF